MAVLKTSERRARLRACERVLIEHMEEFVKVGMALKEIRDDRLYKEAGCKSFEEYLKKNKRRFEFASRRYADRVIRAATIRPSASPT